MLTDFFHAFTDSLLTGRLHGATSSLKFILNLKDPVQPDVFDTRGALVKTLVNGMMEPGTRSVT